jgi:hypothetical protein
MRQERKYYIKYVIGSSSRKGEFTTPDTMSPTSARDKFLEYFHSITKDGTRVKIITMEYRGTVLRIV